MSTMFHYSKFMIGKKGWSIGILMVLLMQIFPVNAVMAAPGGGGGKPVYVLAITSKTPGANFNLTLNGTGSGTPYAGQFADHHVEINWGDGVTDTVAQTEIFINNTPTNGSFTGTWASTHQYPGAGNYTVTAKLYHAQGGGQDASDSAIVVIPVVIPQATLTVIKNVNNNDGGTKTAADFTIQATGTNVSPTSFASSGAGTLVSMDAGNYNILEVADAGYVASYSTDCSGTMTLGQSKTCTITNDDVGVPTTGSLTVIKTVVNDNGGSKAASDFTMAITGTNVSDNSFAGDAAGVTVTLDAGDYSVDENADSVYAKTLSADCSGTIAAGETKTCTITNNDIAPQLTVIKSVTNDNGGTKAAGDFTMNVTGTNVSDTSFAGDAAGVTVTLDGGDYSVDENADGTYAKTLSANCSGTIAVGETKTCTITNDDIAPTLTITKVVDNTYGGSAIVSDFPLFIDAVQVVSGNANTLSAGNYVVSETNLAGYTGVFSGACDAQGNVTLALGENKECTLTNSENYVAPLPATLNVIKTVVNDNGGSKAASDFTMAITGTNVSDNSFPGDSSGVAITLDGGDYSVDENADSVYAKTLSADCSGTIAAGETKTCTITNNDIAPQLTVIKAVTNDNGGTKAAGDFTMNVTGTNVSDTSFAGDAAGVTVTLDAGDYSVDENADGTYAKTLSANCSGTIAVGETKTCTITNDDIASGGGGGPTTGTLTVVKMVVNYDGGTALVSDFPLYINETAVTSGVPTTGLAPGNYLVSEINQVGYSANFSVDCDAQGNVVLAAGDNKTCTITNDDIPASEETATLTVIKNVINNGGRTKTAGDFTMTVTGTNVSDNSFPGSAKGTTVTLDPGSYSVNELTDSTYTKTLGEGCSGTIEAGQSVTCTITNDDIAVVTGGGGGGGGAGGNFPSHTDCISINCLANPAPTTQPVEEKLSVEEVSEEAVSGEVLGESTCETYLNEFIHIRKNNNPDEVFKLKKFLNDYLGTTLDLNGVYDRIAFNAVIKFQKKEWNEVLDPWNLKSGTGYVYLTTTRKINMIMCPELNLPIPAPLVPDTNVMDNL